MSRLLSFDNPGKRIYAPVTVLASAVLALVVAMGLAAAVVGGSFSNPALAYAASGASGEAAGGTVMAGKVSTLAAKKYKIVYKLNGGVQAVNQVKTIKKGNALKVSKLKKPTRKYYKFVGWYSNKKLTKKATKLKGVSKKATRTVYAKWKRTSYPIAYKLNGGVFKSGYTEAVGVGKTLKVSKLKKPVKEGYTFAGWYTDKNLSKKAKSVKGKSAKSSRTLYAKWTKIPIYYQVYYKANGGLLPAAYTKSYTSDKGLDDLAQPTRPGYSFMGWYTDSGLTNAASSIPVGSTGDKVLYAKWRKRVIVAHRGYFAGGEVQNSLAAYEAAAEKGFTYVETDVRFTADGRAVLNHDASILVYAKDEDGKMTGSPFSLKISSVTLYQLQNDYVAVSPAGSVVTPDPPDSASDPNPTPDPSGDPNDQGGTDATDDGLEPAEPIDDTEPYTQNVAEFDEFLDVCEQYDLVPYIEMKSGAKDQIESLVREVDSRGMTNGVRWLSFDYDLLGYVKAIHPTSSFTLLSETFSNSLIGKARALGSDGGDVVIGLKASQAKALSVAACKAAGIPLGIWTITDENAISKYDNYISDFTVNKIAGVRVPNNV